MRKFFDNLLTLCRQWDSDKWAHIVGAIIVAWIVATISKVIMLAMGMEYQRVIPGLCGAAIASLGCIWKEWFDKRTEDLWDGQDLSAGFVGVAIFIIIYLT